MLVLDDATLVAYLREDAPYGDLTTRSLDLKATTARMRLEARGGMAVCGVEEAARIVTLAGGSAEVACASGDRLDAETPILEAEGGAEAIMLAWKVAQTLTEWASGVATMAARLVDGARAVNPDVIVACTRKAIPGTRALSAKAVLAGGASLHRTGLSDSLLLFPEHRNLVAGVATLQRQIDALKRACPERSVVVEVTSVAEALAAEGSGADVVQLEKFTVGDVADLMARLPGGTTTKIAVAGGVNVDNAAEYASTGAHVLVTSAPYYAKPADVKVTIGS